MFIKQVHWLKNFAHSQIFMHFSNVCQKKNHEFQYRSSIQKNSRLSRKSSQKKWNHNFCTILKNICEFIKMLLNLKISMTFYKYMQTKKVMISKSCSRVQKLLRNLNFLYVFRKMIANF